MDDIREPNPVAMSATRGARGHYMLLRIVEVAMEDEILTDDESAILDVIASVMGLESTDVQDSLAIASGSMSNPHSDDDIRAHNRRRLGDMALYQNVLITALDDEVITDDEMAMLDVLRRVLRLQSDEHAMMVEQIRLLASRSEGSERLTERRERYLVRLPFA